MKYNVYESLGVDKGAIIALEVRLNRILNEFSKKYNKCFYTKYDEYEMRDVLWCNTTIICALDTNEHFTSYTLTKELNNFCEKYLKEDTTTNLKDCCNIVL